MWTLVWSGQLDEAKSCAAQVRGRLSNRGFQLQRWYLEFGEIFTSLFERDGEGAWRHAHDSWPLFRLGFPSQVQRIAARWVRANAALARAVVSPSVRPAMLAEAHGLARRIDREQVSWAKAIARSVSAGIASVGGDDDTALRLLAEAEPLLESCHLESVLAAARYFRGRLMGGESGRALIDRAEAWMAHQHAQPSALWQQLPGCWPE
jgi:eukaryotic-like serine/threonine-protein kinase